MSTASTFIMARGSSLSISTDGGTTNTPVKQLQQVSYSGGKLNFDDITNIDSPGSFMEVAPTTNDPGMCQLTGVFSDADPGQTMFNAAFNAATLLTVTMQMAPRGSQTKGFKRVFTAYVGEPINYSYGTTKAMTFSASLKVTGPFTDTPGA